MTHTVTDNLTRQHGRISDMNTLFEREIPAYGLDIVTERVEKVNRRAAKRGFPMAQIVTGNRVIKSDPNFQHLCNPGDFGVGSAGCDETIPQIEYVNVSIVADGTLSLAGWTLVGVIAADAVDMDGNTVPMITTVPGQSFDGTISDAMLCMHCNARRNRTETFIVRNESGIELQVGRQCIRDFLGHDPAALLAGFDAWSDMIPTDDEIERWGSAAPAMLKVHEIVDAAARVVAAQGWYVSKAKALESEYSDRPLTSTAVLTSSILFPPRNPKHRAQLLAQYPENERSIALADATMAALETLNPSNEWEAKLAQYRTLSLVGTRHIGTIASSLILALRDEEKKARAAAKPTSVHIGAVGAKVTGLPVEITFTKEFFGNYGLTTIVKMRADAGNLTWFASGAQNFKVGDRVTLSGTVKAHDLDKFDQSPVTIVTRCKIV